jgi:hypothetical protein
MDDDPTITTFQQGEELFNRLLVAHSDGVLIVLYALFQRTGGDFAAARRWACLTQAERTALLEEKHLLGPR